MRHHGKHELNGKSHSLGYKFEKKLAQFSIWDRVGGGGEGIVLELLYV